MDVAEIDRKIMAIKNSTEYRRLITAHRGPREDQELAKKNVHLSTLENKKAQLEATKQKPVNPNRPEGLGKPQPPKTGLPPKQVTRSVKPAASNKPVHKITTFLPLRPVGLKPPAKPVPKLKPALAPTTEAEHIDATPSGVVPADATQHAVHVHAHGPGVTNPKPTKPAAATPAATSAKPAAKRPSALSTKAGGKPKAKPKEAVKELDDLVEEL